MGLLGIIKTLTMFSIQVLELNCDVFRTKEANQLKAELTETRMAEEESRKKFQDFLKLYMGKVYVEHYFLDFNLFIWPFWYPTQFTIMTKLYE